MRGLLRKRYLGRSGELNESMGLPCQQPALVQIRLRLPIALSVSPKSSLPAIPANLEAVLEQSSSVIQRLASQTKQPDAWMLLFDHVYHRQSLSVMQRKALHP